MKIVSFVIMNRFRYTCDVCTTREKDLLHRMRKEHAEFRFFFLLVDQTVQIRLVTA